MQKFPSLAFLYRDKNKFSLNALFGAMDTDLELKEWPVTLFKTSKELLEQISDFVSGSKQSILAISICTPQIWEIHALLKKIRAATENSLIIIAGGPHVSADPEGTLRMGFDLVFTGEAEKSFIEFLNLFRAGKAWNKIQGTAYLDENQNFVSNGRRLPPDLNLYKPHSVSRHRFSPVDITRGCPFGCAFCQTTRLSGSIVRHRSAESFADCVKDFRELWLQDVRVLTPNALSYGSADGLSVELDKIEDLFIKARKEMVGSMRLFFGSFPSEVRPEHVSRDALSLIRRFADNESLVIGAQSGSERVLKNCRRGHTVSDILNAAKLAVEAGFLEVPVDFIFGLPGETEADVLETVKIMEELVSIGAKIHAHSFIPLPGTPFYHETTLDGFQKYQKTLEKLIPAGYVFGSFQKQSELALKILNYRDHGFEKEF